MCTKHTLPTPFTCRGCGGCGAPLKRETANGHTVRSFSTHGPQSAAQGRSTTVSRSDIRLIQHLDSSAHGLVRREVALTGQLLAVSVFPLKRGLAGGLGARSQKMMTAQYSYRRDVPSMSNPPEATRTPTTMGGGGAPPAGF
jgi:hypothetical protein